MVTITYGHGYLNDGDSISDWAETRSNMADPDTTFEVSNGDVYKLTGVTDEVGQVESFYIKNGTHISKSTATYPKYLIRYKTGVTSIGLGAAIYVEYSDADSEWILGSAATPVFSTVADTWTVKAGTFTKSKTIDHVYFYAMEDAAASANGTYYVYYDFLLVHQGTFTFPNLANSDVIMDLGSPRSTLLPIPRRVGDVTQNLGTELATFTVTGDLNVNISPTNSWKRTTPADYTEGEVLYDIVHNSVTEPWQWLDTEIEQFKVTVEEPQMRRTAGGRYLSATFREYRLGGGGNETYVERFGLNL